MFCSAGYSVAQLVEVTVPFDSSMSLLGVDAFLDVLKAPMSHRDPSWRCSRHSIFMGFYITDPSFSVLKKALREDRMPIG